ncbi:hypothetical protein SNOUR_42790 [Streptomyces noursei ATCC 11455]|uniref:hypothetical protein n=1 Tax=Streptomyces noursei TaxID=1971 RepID=UPI00081CAAE0|nr:hypothetical protein SNOUR_42790 [Streptomyces noursei ATCC 11455]
MEYQPEPVPFSGPGPGGPAEDPFFGRIDIGLDTRGGVLTVQGRRLPRVELRRLPGAEVDERIPIGTREVAWLTMSLDGASVHISPAKGRLSRRSYRVDVTYEGADYRLVPRSSAESKLLKDERRIGTFASRGDGTVVAVWRHDAKALPQDAAVGYALAAGFGTGGQSALMVVVDIIGGLIP